MNKVVSSLMACTLALSIVPVVESSADDNKINAKVVTVDNTASYLVLDASDAASVPQSIKLDGKAVEFTKVDDAGKILKREFDGSHKTMTVEFKDGHTEEENLASAYKKFPYKVASANQVAPGAVVAHTSMAVWDYHSCKKDAEGNRVVYPEKTTFDISDDERQGVDTETGSTPEQPPLTENPNPEEEMAYNEYEFGKDIIYVYDLKDPKKEAQFDSITGVQEIFENTITDSTLNPLDIPYQTYEQDNKGYLVLRATSAGTLSKNRGHEIRIVYSGDVKNAEIKKFYIKKPAPIIQLNSNSGEYTTGKALTFRARGYNYLFQQDQGIRAVYLNGVELTRDRNRPETENQWYAIDELFGIRNSGVDHFRVGPNYLTIKYDGFHDSNYMFTLDQGSEVKPTPEPEKPVEKTKKLPTKKLNLKVKKTIKKDRFKAINKLINSIKVKTRGVDTLSGSTGGGGGMGTPGIGGDGIDTVIVGFRAVYNFDMVANATILEKLGYFDEDGVKLLDAWTGSAKLRAVTKENTDRNVVWDSYLTFVKNNKAHDGVYKSFGEYANDPSVETTGDRFYSAKYIFGTTYGEVFYDQKNIFEQVGPSEEPGKELSEFEMRKLDTLTVDKDVRITAWTYDGVEISIDGKELVEGEDYKFDKSNSKLVIFGKNFSKPGLVVLNIKSDGFQTYDHACLVKYASENSIPVTVENKELVAGKQLMFDVAERGLQINSLAISHNGGEYKELEVEKDYKFSPVLKTIYVKDHIFKNAGKYSLKVNFAGYKESVTDFFLK